MTLIMKTTKKKLRNVFGIDIGSVNNVYIINLKGQLFVLLDLYKRSIEGKKRFILS